MEMVTERLTGILTPTFQSEAMKWGVAWEATASDAYVKKTGNVVRHVSFIDHPTIPMVGVSPDGLVYEKGTPFMSNGEWFDHSFGLKEIKCPHTKTHFAAILSEKWDVDYEDQMTMQMGCTGADWCDFVSFDPRLPEEMQLYIARYPFDAGKWGFYEQLIVEFLAEVDADLLKIRKRFGLAT
jgi:hypothetical protein